MSLFAKSLRFCLVAQAWLFGAYSVTLYADGNDGSVQTLDEIENAFTENTIVDLNDPKSRAAFELYRLKKFGNPATSLPVNALDRIARLQEEFGAKLNKPTFRDIYFSQKVLIYPTEVTATDKSGKSYKPSFAGLRQSAGELQGALLDVSGQSSVWRWFFPKYTSLKTVLKSLRPPGIEPAKWVAAQKDILQTGARAPEQAFVKILELRQAEAKKPAADLDLVKSYNLALYEIARNPASWEHLSKPAKADDFLASAATLWKQKSSGADLPVDKSWRAFVKSVNPQAQQDIALFSESELSALQELPKKDQTPWQSSREMFVRLVELREQKAKLGIDVKLINQMLYDLVNAAAFAKGVELKPASEDGRDVLNSIDSAFALRSEFLQESDAEWKNQHPSGASAPFSEDFETFVSTTGATRSKGIPLDSEIQAQRSQIESLMKAQQVEVEKSNVRVRPLSLIESPFRSCIGGTDCSSRTYFTRALDPNYVYFTMTDDNAHSSGHVTVVLGTASGNDGKPVKVAFVDKVQNVTGPVLEPFLESVRVSLLEGGYQLAIPKALGDHNGISNIEATRNQIGSLGTFRNGLQNLTQFVPHPHSFSATFDSKYSRAYHNLDVVILGQADSRQVKTKHGARHDQKSISPDAVKTAISQSYLLKLGSNTQKIQYLKSQSYLRAAKLGEDPDFDSTVARWIAAEEMPIAVKVKILEAMIPPKNAEEWIKTKQNADKMFAVLKQMPHNQQEKVLMEYFKSPKNHALAWHHFLDVLELLPKGSLRTDFIEKHAPTAQLKLPYRGLTDSAAVSLALQSQIPYTSIWRNGEALNFLDVLELLPEGSIRRAFVEKNGPTAQLQLPFRGMTDSAAVILALQSKIPYTKIRARDGSWLDFFDALGVLPEGPFRSAFIEKHGPNASLRLPRKGMTDSAALSLAFESKIPYASIVYGDVGYYSRTVTRFGHPVPTNNPLKYHLWDLLEYGGVKAIVNWEKIREILSFPEVAHDDVFKNPEFLQMLINKLSDTNQYTKNQTLALLYKRMVDANGVGSVVNSSIPHPLVVFAAAGWSKEVTEWIGLKNKYPYQDQDLEKAFSHAIQSEDVYTTILLERECLGDAKTIKIPNSLIAKHQEFIHKTNKGEDLRTQDSTEAHLLKLEPLVLREPARYVGSDAARELLTTKAGLLEFHKSPAKYIRSLHHYGFDLKFTDFLLSLLPGDHPEKPKIVKDLAEETLTRGGYSNYKIGLLLLKHGLDPNQMLFNSFHGVNPVFYYSMRETSDEDLALHLLNLGVSPHEFAPTHNYTPLQLAAREGFYQVALKLLEKGANVDAVTAHEPLTALQIAAEYQGSLRLAKVLIDKGASLVFKPNSVEGSGQSHNSQDFIDWFTKPHVDRSMSAEDTKKLKVYEDEVIKSLITRSSNKGITSSQFQQLSLYLGKSNRGDMLRDLISFTKGSVQELGISKDLIQLALNHKQSVVLRLMLNKGLSPNWLGLEDTLLNHFIKENDIEMVELLLARGALVNGEPDKVSPLALAAWLGNDEMIRLLKNHGANVCYFDKKRDAYFYRTGVFTPAVENRDNLGSLKVLATFRALAGDGYIPQSATKGIIERQGGRYWGVGMRSEISSHIQAHQEIINSPQWRRDLYLNHIKTIKSALIARSRLIAEGRTLDDPLVDRETQKAHGAIGEVVFLDQERADLRVWSEFDLALKEHFIGVPKNTPGQWLLSHLKSPVEVPPELFDDSLVRQRAIFNLQDWLKDLILSAKDSRLVSGLESSFNKIHSNMSAKNITDLVFEVHQLASAQTGLLENATPLFERVSLQTKVSVAEKLQTIPQSNAQKIVQKCKRFLHVLMWGSR